MKNKIKKLLDKYNINYITSGNDVGKNCINITCPYCNDDLFHRGLNYETLKSRCWRCGKPKPIIFTLQDIIGISIEEIKEQLGLEKIASNDIFKEVLSILNPEKKEDKIVKAINHLVLPEYFFKIKTTGITERFWSYLSQRGFQYDKNKLNKYFRGCLVGEEAFRIIIPIYMNEKLMTWTARSIYKEEKLRYKTLPSKYSIKKITDCLLDYDDIKNGGDFLFICEGPFDAIKLNWYLPKDSYATCLFTKNISKQQILLLSNIVSKFKKTFIMLDKEDTINNMINIKSNLSLFGNVDSYFLTEADDPGDLTREQIINIINKVKT
jgi:hypothetical protein